MGQHNNTDLCFYLYDTRLEIAKENKYLGVLISRKCDDSTDKEWVADSFNKRFGFYYEM